MNITTQILNNTPAAGLAVGGLGAIAASKGNKKTGFALIALGTALFAYRFFGPEPGTCLHLDATPIQNCSLDELLTPIREGGGDRKAVLDLLEEAREVNCDNFLPWQENFHCFNDFNGDYMDGIRPSHLKENIMWGVDNTKRFFVALKSKCELDSAEKVSLIFQRYPHDTDMLGGGSFRNSALCFPWARELTLSSTWKEDVKELFHTGFAHFRDNLHLIKLA